MSRPSANPQGNPRSAGQKPSLPALPPGWAPPPPPETLPPEAAQVWTDVWTAGGAAYNPKTDGWVIARYSEMTVRRLRLLETLATEGWTTVGSTGQVVAHPAARLLADVETKLTALEDRLGLNPEARIRLGIATVERESKLSKFLAGEDPAPEPER